MSVEYFVDQDSIVRKIWGKSDTVLFIFAGAAAEFALNKAVDWLYFTGRLPADPIGRLFTTVSYAKAIIFSEKQHALRTIESMNSIHGNVETKRGSSIPDWAYRDVLFLLIDYSIRSYEVLENQLSQEEKNEVFQVFNRVGIGMHLKGLPDTFEDYERMRHDHLINNLQYSHYTKDLFNQYRKHLGLIRYRILQEVQVRIAPSVVRELLGFRRISLLNLLLVPYKVSKVIRLDWILRALLLPTKYKKQILAIDTPAKVKSPILSIPN